MYTVAHPSSSHTANPTVSCKIGGQGSERKLAGPCSVHCSVTSRSLLRRAQSALCGFPGGTRMFSDSALLFPDFLSSPPRASLCINTSCLESPGHTAQGQKLPQGGPLGASTAHSPELGPAGVPPATRGGPAFCRVRPAPEPPAGSLQHMEEPLADVWIPRLRPAGAPAAAGAPPHASHASCPPRPE